MRLDLLKRAGKIKHWEPFRTPHWHGFELVVNRVKIGTYHPDFAVLQDGVWRFVEVKGTILAEWRMKQKLMEALRPDVLLTVVKASSL